MSIQDFTTRLLPGERIVWSGAPQQGIMFTPRDGYLIPFSLLWGGFAVFWESAVLFGIGGHAREAGPIGLLFPLWGVPFVVMGLYITVGRFLHDAWLRSRTRYALTDRRALILRGGQFTAVDLKRLDTVRLKGGGARGTIVFGPDQDDMFGRGRAGFGAWLPSLAGGPRFLGVSDAQAVFNRIETLRAAAA